MRLNQAGAGQRPQAYLQVNAKQALKITAGSKPVLSAKVEATFGLAEIKVRSHADLYGGNLAVALDRLRPRVLFDVRDRLAIDGSSDELRRAFIVSFISHARPMAEVLDANLKDIADEYKRGFAGMTEEDVPAEAVLAAGRQMIDSIIGGMRADHR